MDENHHYDVAIRKTEDGFEAVGKLNIGTIKSIEKIIPINSGKAKLIITSDNYNYYLYFNKISDEYKLAWGQTRYLSSEVASGFTGVVIGLFAVDGERKSTATFENFECNYTVD